MRQKTDKTQRIRKIAPKQPGPEKAGVGGSTPSRGTIPLNNETTPAQTGMASPLRD